MRVYLIGFAAALAAMAGFSAWQQGVGVKKERERVVAIGEKTHARAKAARKKVEAKKPEELRVDLRRYCIDC
jgi:hypothetical protein